MAYIPSVRTEVDGGTTVDEALTATSVQTPPFSPDPTVAATLTAVDPATIPGSVAIEAGDYYVQYAWVIGNGYTAPAPRNDLVVDGSTALKVELPTAPDGIVGMALYSDNAAGDILRQVAFIAAADLANPITLAAISPSDFAALPPTVPLNGTGAGSELSAPLTVNGGIVAGTGIEVFYSAQLNCPTTVQYGLSEWNATPAALQPEITGALSGVTDPAAKALLTSIIAVLAGKGSAKDSTS